jgi:hypothetical protein
MAIDGGDAASDAQAARSALDGAMAQLPDEDRAEVPDRIARRILGIGLRLGLADPAQARRMLELIEAEAGAQAGTEPGTSGQIPLRSMILARAAAMTESDLAGEDPQSRFGWAARLTRGEVLSLGRVIGEMLARGESPDIARGFGLAWDAGVRLPRTERNGMFAQFAELEVTVGGVLEGRDLRADQGSARPAGLEGLFSWWLSRPRVGDARASAAIEQGGDPARRGLVAVWNVWAAMRFRDVIPRPTFELLVEPWVTVVGGLPEP